MDYTALNCLTVRLWQGGLMQRASSVHRTRELLERFALPPIPAALELDVLEQHE